jgi:hypothetical protein
MVLLQTSKLASLRDLASQQVSVNPSSRPSPAFRTSIIYVHCGPEAGNYLQRKWLANALESVEEEIVLLTSPTRRGVEIVYILRPAVRKLGCGGATWGGEWGE